MLSWEWLAPTVSGLVSVGGLISGWSISKQSWRQTKRLAQENNEHAIRMAEEATLPSKVVERFNAWYEQLFKTQYAVARHADVLHSTAAAAPTTTPGSPGADRRGEHSSVKWTSVMS